MGNRYGLEIRAAAPADAAGLAELLAASGHPVPAPVLAEGLERVRRAQGTALLALEWGPPSGLVALHWYPSLDRPAPTAAITMLVVGPDARRRGIGRQLLKAAAQAARMAGCDAVRLSVPPDAVGLSAFCAATGFEPDADSFVRKLRKKG